MVRLLRGFGIEIVSFVVFNSMIEWSTWNQESLLPKLQGIDA